MDTKGPRQVVQPVVGDYVIRPIEPDCAHRDCGAPATQVVVSKMYSIPGSQVIVFMCDDHARWFGRSMQEMGRTSRMEEPIVRPMKD